MTQPWSVPAQAGCPACTRPAQTGCTTRTLRWPLPGGGIHAPQLRRAQLPASGAHLEEGPLALQVVNVLQGRQGWRQTGAAVIP